MATDTPLLRIRPFPSVGTILLALVGLALLFSYPFWGVACLVLAWVSWNASRIEITSRYLKVRRGLLSGTTELHLAKLETIHTGMAIGPMKPVAVIGTGGTRYDLGTIGSLEEFREVLEHAMEGSRKTQ